MQALIWIVVAVVVIGGAIGLALVGMRFARQTQEPPLSKRK